jgi:DNA-binding CsgD family transcriptional regulator
MDDRTFDKLVASLYSAASCTVSWESALDGVCEAFSARLVFLHTADTRDGRIISIRYGGIPSNDSVLEYIRTYHQHDPRRAAVLNHLPQLVGRWWHCDDHFDESFASSDRFYCEFLASYNARYTSTALLAPGGSNDPVMTAFALELPLARGPLSTDEREQLQRLGAHVLEALKIHQQVHKLMAQALAGHRLLMNFSYPMWLLDEQRGISFQNSAGGAMMAAGERVAQVNGRLRLTRQRADRRLTEVLRQLFRDPHGSMAVIDVRSCSADPPIWLHLAVLSPAAALGAFGTEHKVLVTLFDPHHVSILDPFALSSMFGLTPAEAKVAAGLGNGYTAAQIGEQLGTSEATIRTQTRQVLAKLAVPRTVDVVRLLRQGEALWASAGHSLI